MLAENKCLLLTFLHLGDRDVRGREGMGINSNWQSRFRTLKSVYRPIHGAAP